MDLNCDSLSVGCKKSDCSFSDCDSDYDLNPLVDEVHDRQKIEDQPALHEKYSDDCSFECTSVSFDWEHSSEQSYGIQGLVFVDIY